VFDTVVGLPVHPLVVHATVVVVPAAALAVGLAALVPRFRRWAGLLPLLLSALAVVLTFVATESGEALRARLGASGLIDAHADLGRGLRPWVLALLAASLLLLWADRRARRAARRGGGRPPRLLTAVAVAAALVTAAGTSFQVIRAGHSGATAVWSGVVQSTTAGGGD
jgi:hypothetical protein